jgi:hypothetical protein
MPPAGDDLRRLKKTRRKVWQAADRLLGDLETDPLMGDSCGPPLVGARRLHFWNDKYRLVWYVDEEEREVDVLGCDLKTSNFYTRMAERFAGLIGV